VRQNYTLESIDLSENNIQLEGMRALQSMLRINCSITSVAYIPTGNADMNLYHSVNATVTRCCRRNKKLAWSNVHAYLIELSLVFIGRLPPYVLLEMFDWLPVPFVGSKNVPKWILECEYESAMCLTSHHKKISLIVGVEKACKKCQRRR